MSRIVEIELKKWGANGSRYFGHFEGGGGVYLQRTTTVLDNLSKPALFEYYSGTTATWWLNRMTGLSLKWDQLKPLRKSGRPVILDFARSFGKGEEYACQLANCIEQVFESLKAPTDERDAAGDLGTEVHRAIHHYGQKGFEPDWLATAAVEVRHAFACWLDWWHHSGLTVKHLEYSVAHRELGYAGTLDALCYDQAGQVVLCDWKTSKSIYPDHTLQVAAYALAYADTGNPLPDKAIIVHVPKFLEQQECRVAWAWQNAEERKRLIDCWRHFARAMQLRPSKVEAIPFVPAEPVEAGF